MADTYRQYEVTQGAGRILVWFKEHPSLKAGATVTVRETGEDWQIVRAYRQSYPAPRSRKHAVWTVA